MPVTIVTFQEFASHQNCPYVTVRRGLSMRTGDAVGTYVFANGATSDGENHRDPPADPRKEQLVYYRSLHDAEVRAFSEYKQMCLDQAMLHRNSPLCCPPPPADAVTQLKEGQGRVQALRVEIQRLEDSLRDPKAEEDLREREGREARRVSRASSLEAEIRRIEV